MEDKVGRATLTPRESAILESAAVARLATVRPDGRPHLVPITFAFVSPDVVVTVVDHKPKRTPKLQRLRNIEANPEASLLVDHYSDDWSSLWWLRVDAAAHVVREEPYRTTLIGALIRKYEPYVTEPPVGPVITLRIHAVTSWNLGREAGE